MARMHLTWTNADPIRETLGKFAVKHSLSIMDNVNDEDAHDVIMSVPQSRFEDMVDELMNHILSPWQQEKMGRTSLLPNSDVICEDEFQASALQGFLLASVGLSPELLWWEVDRIPQDPQC